jgi:hypothetical protein
VLTLTERIAKFKEKREKASPQEWTLRDCSNGGLILIRQPLEGQRHAIQSHLQVLPTQDAEFIAAAANEALPLIEELQALLITTASDRNAHYELCRVYEKRLEAAEALLKSIDSDMRYKPVHFDWPASAKIWFNGITAYFKDKDNR